MSILKEYEHLSNSDVAEHLAGHRLVQEGQRQKRFEGVALPFGEKLIKLVRERLTALTGDQPAEPEQPVLAPLEQTLATVSAIGTLDDLVNAYVTLLAATADLGTDEQVDTALAEMKDRVHAAVAATIEPVQVEVPGPAPTDEQLIEQFSAINNLADLETELAGSNGETVVAAVTAMTGRVRDAVIRDLPAPVVAEAAPAPEAKAAKTSKEKPAAQ
jgi:hypothetical protein